MEKINYPDLKESVYHEKLPNGLNVYLMPKYGFNKTYATFTTNFGSIDGLIGEKEIPKGIAHFLEHQLFSKVDGDVSEKFAENGANVNAFTTYDKTSYLFSCTSKVEDNLNLLLDFVQEPYFTEESVVKERGIITEELQMYSDNPDVKIILEGMNNLFAKHPLKDDIGGTVETIKDIDADILLEAHSYFYHPSNMIVVVVGNIDPEKVMEIIRINQSPKNFDHLKEYTRNIPFEAAINKKESTLIQENVFEKGLLAYKGGPEIYKGNYEKYKLSMMVYLDILFGRSSKNYEMLFKEELINYTFGSIAYIEPDYSVVIIGGDTSNPDKLITRLNELIDSEIDKEQFIHMKNKFYGSMLKLLNYPEGIANEFTSFKLAGSDLFNIINIINDITLDDVVACKNFFKNGVTVKMKTE